MLYGNVFSIEEFATYDGPGIRMTVFLKGCPLNCIWCHNPEGQRFESEIVRSPNGCINCGACLNIGEKTTGKPCLVEQSIAVCPQGLVRICGTEYTSYDIIEAIKKNASILNASGGGVTFSGGEPIAQPDFLCECLEKLKGVTNRAVQTTGYASPSVFARVLERCDYMLYDLKLMDDEKHRYYTGVSNKNILENFVKLAKSGKEFCPRIPLIPTVNDTAENIIATAVFLKDNNVKYIELLPYNKMAGGKYAMLGRTYHPDFDGTLAPQIHEDIFNKYGIEVNVL